ncbi:MAG: hypothetical protein ABFS03_00910 [Chloroflexota bacterium]
MSNEELDGFVETEQSETVETTADSQVAEDVKTETATETDTQKVEKDDVPTTSTTETMIPLAAKQAEKERRKQAEDRAQRAEVELARLQGMNQANAKPEEVPDPYTQPEEYTQHVINQQNTKIASDQNTALKARLSAAEDVARVELDDYDKYADHFAKVVAPNNPQMIDMMKASPDPAKYAYYKGKQAFQDAEVRSQIEQAGGLSGYEAQLRTKIEAELAEKKPETTIPPDLSAVRNTGGEPTGDSIADGTDGLNQLLGR